MFVAKKVIANILLPPSFLLLILGIALFLLFFTSRQRLGKLLALISFIALLVLSLPSSASLLLGGLERHYPPLSWEKTSEPKALYIALLTANSYKNGGDEYNPGGAGVARAQEAARLSRLLPNLNIIICGDTISSLAMKQALVILGIDVAKIIIDKESCDTIESIRNLSKTIKTEKFILITSASHLPRAMLLAKQYGLSPIPAPCDYSANFGFINPIQKFLPEARHMARSAAALNEYYGIAYYQLTQRLRLFF